MKAYFTGLKAAFLDFIRTYHEWVRHTKDCRGCRRRYRAATKRMVLLALASPLWVWALYVNGVHTYSLSILCGVFMLSALMNEIHSIAQELEMEAMRIKYQQLLETRTTNVSDEIKQFMMGVLKGTNIKMTKTGNGFDMEATVQSIGQQEDPIARVIRESAELARKKNDPPVS
jgi:hypothetical protein